MPSPPDDLIITLEATRYGGRWVARSSAGPESEMTFVHRPGGIIVDHTRVPAALEGRGIARALVERAVNDCRALGLTITPQCSYVAAQARRHPEWADVIVG